MIRSPNTIKEAERFLTFITQHGQLRICAATIGNPGKCNTWDVETNKYGELLYAIWGGKRITKKEAIANLAHGLEWDETNNNIGRCEKIMKWGGQMTAETLLEQLDALITAKIHILNTAKLTWTIDDIAFHTNRSKAYTTNVLTKIPNFPAAIRFDKKGKPLYQRTEVERWILSYKERTAA